MHSNATPGVTTLGYPAKAGSTFTMGYHQGSHGTLRPDLEEFCLKPAPDLAIFRSSTLDTAATLAVRTPSPPRLLRASAPLSVHRVLRLTDDVARGRRTLQMRRTRRLSSAQAIGALLDNAMSHALLRASSPFSSWAHAGCSTHTRGRSSIIPQRVVIHHHDLAYGASKPCLRARFGGYAVPPLPDP